VAVGLERAYPECVGQSDALAQIIFGLSDLRVIALCGNLAEGPKDSRLGALLLVLRRDREGVRGQGHGVHSAATDQRTRAQHGGSARGEDHESHGAGLLQ
jgi:hypothetical protein